MNGRTASQRGRARAVVIATIITLAIALPQAISWLPANEILGPSGRIAAYNIRNVTIQGCGFFTKSPRESTYRIYKEEQHDDQSTSWISASRAPNNQLRNWFGLDRTSRLQKFDVSVLTKDLEPSDWLHCHDVRDLASCAEMVHVSSMKHPAGSFELCGRHLITRAEPLPWSYRNLRSSMPGEAVIIGVVNC
ncbi:SdpA family antimicrobial peptide system protein [Actinomyces qiguomingii]|uniref:SdpA family antimicrobial peptide system protein n=1 Tax=Actinomyces qiguomingii TaxID=2057800 RepID=UPI000CA069AC